MAARIRKIRHDEDTRAKIKTTLLIRRLTDHVTGAIEMSPSQVSAALGLIRKTLPDLQATDLSGSVEHNYVARMPAPIEDKDEWEQRYKPTIQ